MVSVGISVGGAITAAVILVTVMVVIVWTVWKHKRKRKGSYVADFKFYMSI